jgi:hypothetical protein
LLGEDEKFLKAAEAWFEGLDERSRPFTFFEPGSPPYREHIARAYVLSKDPEFESIKRAMDEALKATRRNDFETYRRIAGEVEARNVQGRLGLLPTPEYPRAAPWLTQDIPDAEQFLPPDRALPWRSMSVPKPAKASGLLSDSADDVDDGLIAYHGSPHTFDKFSTDKIGTGEGAQAYGHGLYFAEAEDVAKGYRDRLKSMAPFDVESEAIKRGINNISKDARIEFMRQANTDVPIDRAVKNLQYANIELRSQPAEVLSDMMKSYRGAKSGSMYQVRLNVKPDELLDWDMPLSEQPQAIQSAIRNTGAGTHRESSWSGPQKPMGGPTHWVNNGTFVRETPSGYEYGRGSAWDAKAEGSAKTLGEAQAKATVVPVPKTGREVFSDLDRTQPRVAHPETTRKLKEAGIKGIRYKDKGSRGTDGGSYNYVIFDDSIIDILKRYGIPMTAAAGGGVAVSGRDMPPEIAAQIKG